jgi:transaldolase
MRKEGQPMTSNRYLQWLTAHTPSIYWHDSAIDREQQLAFQLGACGMTTNPFLVHCTLRDDRAFWQESLAQFPRGLAGDEKALELSRIVTCYYAGKVRPIYEKGEVGKGYVCAQTNPVHTGDEAYMVDQALKISAWAPNIVIKLPATAAGLRAYERCAALGINVAATVSFTVSQVIQVAEAARRGKAQAIAKGIKPGLSIAVLMVGRLADYLRDVKQDSHPHVLESDIQMAGIACIKRAYALFVERGYDTFLMPAGCRGAYHITELAGASMIMSIAPKIAGLLSEVDAFEERIDVPLAGDVIERLMTMPEFQKAYLEDGMKPEQFITFGSANRTTDQFINSGWMPLTNYAI